MRLAAIAALGAILLGCKSETHHEVAPQPPPQVVIVPMDPGATPATRPVAAPRRYVPVSRPAIASVDTEEHRSIEELMQPPLGVMVRVQFRRDAMGLAGSSAIGPEMQGLVARSVQVTGKIEQITAEWFQVRSEGRVYWIPRGVILLIEVL